ncbi:hypothetical protein [Paenibacillus sp. DMB20]|uniref:hypothetical protein n=1 Tax=Paenibacillus sp. DMB20 TaxID=1642570 RepID=UPI000627C701|nr:hypothetical protein [Paenibacillus sp. DMB20]KKO54445.1 hypothetical protein XI25_06390 [Paenibacillus sp. DMB20]
MIFYVIVIALILIGGISTMMVGLSQENRKSNPDYGRKTRSNMVRLVAFYVVALAAFVLVWVIFD